MRSKCWECASSPAGSAPPLPRTRARSARASTSKSSTGAVFDPVLLGFELLSAIMKFHPGKFEPAAHLLGSDEVLAKRAQAGVKFWRRRAARSNSSAAFGHSTCFTSKVRTGFLTRENDYVFMNVGC